MKKSIPILLFIAFVVLLSCQKKEVTSYDIFQKTINSIDTIESISFKQDMSRTNPRNTSETIFRHREMYFSRLLPDSIVGVKGHWFMYVDDKENVIYEDIYDGNRLIRKNNQDSSARIYDLVKFPDFRKQRFWGHNTTYLMQHEMKFILGNQDAYQLTRLNDTIVNGLNCYQVLVSLENQMTMPGFEIQLQENEGNISETTYYIDKKNNYPIRMRGESYSIEEPLQRFFIDQFYYDIQFNIEIDENILFNTTESSLAGFEKQYMKPTNTY